MLKQRALTATAWSGADLLLRQSLQFATTVFLARLLTPEDFGSIAMLMLFIGIAVVLLDGGFSAALIQRRDVDQTDESTVFWFNVGIGSAVALCLCVIAPHVASFYRQPVLMPLTNAMALTVFIGSLGAIHQTLLSRQLDFRTQMKVNAAAGLIAGGIAIVMAWRGYGVWALAIQSIAMASVTTALLWVVSPWRPTWRFSRASAQKLFRFGGYYLASSLLEIAYSRVYTLLIGRLYGVRALGFYSNADSTRQIPAGFLAAVLSRVTLPMFSTAASDKATLRRGVQLSIRGMMLFNAPAMLGMAVVAEPLVDVLFGPQWLPAVPILRVLCLAGVLFPLHAINLQVLMAHGYSSLMFRLELIKKLLGVGLIAGGAIWGVLGIAWSQVLFSLLAFGINARYTGKLLGYGGVAQMRDFAPVCAIAVVVAAIVYFAGLHWQAAPLLKLAGLVALGVILFFGLATVTRLHALRDLLALVPRNSRNSAGPGDFSR